MDTKTKRLMISIYYTGLIAGAFLMNYILVQHSDFSLSLIESFQGLDKLDYINKKELFVYILLKRVKQLLVCSYVYFYISKVFLLYFVDFYFAIIMGMTIAVFVYYQGFTGLIYSILLFVPLFLSYGGIYYMAWINFLNKIKNTYKRKNKRIILLIFLIIIGVILEITVNNLFGTCFFNNK